MTQDYKKMTVDEAVDYYSEKLEKCCYHDYHCEPGWTNYTNAEKLLKELIESQRARAVEEYKEKLDNLSKELFPLQLEESSSVDLNTVKQLLPKRIGWLPITDEQKDGNPQLVAEIKNGVRGKTKYLKYSSENDVWLSGPWAADINPTHYLPIDQIPLPEKEQVKEFFNDPENIEAIKEWDACVGDGLNDEARMMLTTYDQCPYCEPGPLGHEVIAVCCQCPLENGECCNNPEPYQQWIFPACKCPKRYNDSPF